jgi:hypothetical protein
LFYLFSFLFRIKKAEVKQTSQLLLVLTSLGLNLYSQNRQKAIFISSCTTSSIVNVSMFSRVLLPDFRGGKALQSYGLILN